MIVSFRHRGLRTFFERGSTRGIPAQYAPRIRRMLTAIDTAHSLAEIDLFPGWRLHPLRGDYAGLWSLTVTGNLRLIFTFEDGQAGELNLADYH